MWSMPDMRRKHHRQAEVRGHHLVRPQQPTQPALGGQDGLGAIHQLCERFIELETGHDGKNRLCAEQTAGGCVNIDIDVNVNVNVNVQHRLATRGTGTVQSARHDTGHQIG